MAPAGSPNVGLKAYCWISVGDWEAAEARAQSLPDQEPGGSDDEVYGEFEDMETGAHQNALKIARRPF